MVFAVQASSITEGSAGPCGVGDPSGEKAVSASSVGRQWAGGCEQESCARASLWVSGDGAVYFLLHFVLLVHLPAQVDNFSLLLSTYLRFACTL